MKISSSDRLILQELQNNGRASLRQLGKKLKMPPTTIHQKIRRMKEFGVIKKFTTIIDPEKVDLSTTAFILVKRSAHRKRTGKIKSENVGDALARLPEAQEVHVVTGEWDAVLKIRGRNEKEIGKWVVDKLWNMPEVERTLTFFVFHTSKETTELVLE